MKNLFGDEQEFRAPDVWAYVEFEVEDPVGDARGKGWVKRDELEAAKGDEYGEVRCEIAQHIFGFPEFSEYSHVWISPEYDYVAEVA